MRLAWRTMLAGLLPAAPARVADLGCGTGTLALLLAEDGYAVDGVDFSPEMVRRAVAKTEGEPAVTITEGDAFAPPLAAATYDVVLSRHVLWALPDPVEALRRWTALLRPDGRLVLVEGSWVTGAGLTADQVAVRWRPPRGRWGGTRRCSCSTTPRCGAGRSPTSGTPSSADPSDGGDLRRRRAARAPG